MSVVNILMTEDRIYCLTDTLVYTIDEETGRPKGRPSGLRRTKCQTFGNGFAMATRGNVFAGDQADAAVADAADFDAAEALLLAYMPIARDFKKFFEPGAYLEVYLIGWSAAHGGPRAIMVDLPKDADDYHVQVLSPGLRLAPGYPGAVLPVPRPGTPEDRIAAGMVKIARSQFAVRESRFPDMCIGGVQHLTTVGRDGADQRVIGLYDNYDALVEVFGEDPNAEAVAAFRGGARRVAS